MKRTFSRRARYFVVVGAIGFLVDGGILTLLNNVAGLGLLLSRLCSFSVAVTVTWFLNRHFTFSDMKGKRALHEWTRYAIVNSLGALLNLVIFLFLVFRFEILAKVPLVPLAIAAVTALLFNFLASKHIAFRGNQV